MARDQAARSPVCAWDYLVVTAGGERQTRAYGKHLRPRRELGLLAGVTDVLIVADPGDGASGAAAARCAAWRG